MLCCNFPVADIETNVHFINICHDYFVLFDTEITVEIVLGELQYFPTFPKIGTVGKC